MMCWWGVLLTIFSKLLTVFSWPSFTLVYPLYASVRAIESHSQSRNQQCLTYWVLFALVRMSESALAKLLKWLPFWPYAKGVITILLVIQCFAGACYVYNHFIRSYISEASIVWKSELLSDDSIPSEGSSISSEADNSVHAVEKNISENELYESERLVSCAEKVVLGYETTERDNTAPIFLTGVQKEWCCALCLISTSNEKCLIEHLKGKKHKAKEVELILYKRSKKTSRSSPMLKKTNDILIENINHLAVNLENYCKYLNPVRRSITSCKWEKPPSGWTKLNTDGSIDQKSASFGGLLRDFKGDPICGFASKALRDDVFSVELWAIWRGLVLAWRLGVKVIWVESDSLSVVKTINRVQSHNQSAFTFTCLNHVWQLQRKFDKCKVSHSWRETNTAADFLAKMNLPGNDVVLWPDDFPKELRRIIKDDARGRTYFRDSS